MYQSYFNLSEAPFSIAPDPHYLYMSQRHQEALAHLLYGVNGGGGFVLLTGEVGAGKTTVCRCLLEQIPESCDVAYIFNPKLTETELLSTICTEFGIACPPGNPSIKVLVDCINGYLLAAHANDRHTVLIIDEAQNLSADVLEQMRLLTNLETNQRKLLQIILLGQPELVTMLEKPELKQLAQRIIARYHLGPLTKQEVAAYVQHRLEIAGTQRQLFPAALIKPLYRLSGGIPRIINVLCDRALLGAYVQGKERVDKTTLAQAAREVFHLPKSRFHFKFRPLLIGLALIASMAIAATLYQSIEQTPDPIKSASTAQAITPDPTTKSADSILPTDLEWPPSEPRARSKAVAYAALFRTWGTDYLGKDPCRQADKMGLRCQAETGDLKLLRLINQPAVLQMADKQGQKLYATLTQLNDKTATFTIGNTTRAMSLSTLATRWSGQYTLLWRMPPVTQTKTRPGARGPDVEWLRKQLALLNGKAPAITPNPVFDEAMVSQVKQFQIAQGLTPDGSVGAQTLMRLSSATDQTAPKLSRKPQEQGK